MDEMRSVHCRVLSRIRDGWPIPSIHFKLPHTPRRGLIFKGFLSWQSQQRRTALNRAEEAKAVHNLARKRLGQRRAVPRRLAVALPRQHAKAPPRRLARALPGPPRSAPRQRRAPRRGRWPQRARALPPRRGQLRNGLSLRLRLNSGEEHWGERETRSPPLQRRAWPGARLHRAREAQQRAPRNRSINVGGQER